MNDEKIVLIARLKVSAEAIEEMKRLALGIVDDSRAEEGCLNYDVHQSVEDETVFIWHETWRDRRALEAHFEMPHFKEFLASGMQLADGEPQMTVTRMISKK